MPNSRLFTYQGDITKLATDAIVSAANSSLMGGGGVDGAIHRAAGPELRAHCAKLGGCPPGEARITPAFRLSARYIIHTVGPVWSGGLRGEPELLAACYRNAFSLAAANELATIAFPAISCGVYGYPWDEAAAIAVHECRRAMVADAGLREVLLVAFDGTMLATIEAAISAG